MILGLYVFVSTGLLYILHWTGRSETKLTELKSRLSSEVDESASTIPTIIADSMDDEAVERMVSQAKVGRTTAKCLHTSVQLIIILVLVLLILLLIYTAVVVIIVRSRVHAYDFTVWCVKSDRWTEPTLGRSRTPTTIL